MESMSNNEEGRASTRAHSYVGYSIGVAAAWALVLVLSAIFGSDSKQRNTVVVFGGFAIGWLSATIARYVYPPPKKYRQTVGTN